MKSNMRNINNLFFHPADAQLTSETRDAFTFGVLKQMVFDKKAEHLPAALRSVQTCVQH